MSVPRRRDVLTAVRVAMTAAGYEAVGADDTYGLELGGNVSAWVGLTTDVEGDVVEVAPKVGVRHEQIHELVDEARGAHPETTPTVSTMLGYLMPQKSANVVWRFDGGTDVEAQAQNLVDAIATYGRPYMDAHADREAVVEALRGAVPWEYSRMRIPAALLLLGRNDDARAFVTDELAKLGDRSDPAAQSFREFAGRFLERADQT